LSGLPITGVDTTGVTDNIQIVSFTRDFKVAHIQQYTLWQDAWEVYIGRFAHDGRDGVFIYDRISGEARVMDFDKNMQVDQYQALHNLSGNWEIHTGDFKGSGQAQVLMYDPGSGDSSFLVFGSDLSLAQQINNSGWGTDMVLYVGHFGLPTLSIMLYDPVAGQSTFVAFDSSLQVAHQETVQSWDQKWQILVGAFLDRSSCLTDHSCTNGDDILVLNRQTGEMEQFVFTFGNQYGVYDNRSQAFLRMGAAPTANVSPVDSSSFTMKTTLDTSIHDEELY
jgi:hypothetical protein